MWLGNLPEWLKITLGLLMITGFVLVYAAKRYPDVRWLQPFRPPARMLDPVRQERMRRAANLRAGMEMVLAGIVVPLGYFALTLMTWSDFHPVITLLVGGFSVALIACGIWVIARTGKRRSEMDLR